MLNLNELEIIYKATLAINFFGGGFENHRLFWETMTPNGNGKPAGELADSIDVYFDDFENFKKIFSEKEFDFKIFSKVG